MRYGATLQSQLKIMFASCGAPVLKRLLEEIPPALQEAGVEVFIGAGREIVV